MKRRETTGSGCNRECRPASLSIRCGSVLSLLAGLIVLLGCSSSKAPLALTSLDPSQDHWKIAAQYSQEASGLRQKAGELRERARVYEQLFGSDSEWVRGARLLAQFYEETARDREQQAGIHVGLAGGRSSLPLPSLSQQPAGR